MIIDVFRPDPEGPDHIYKRWRDADMTVLRRCGQMRSWSRCIPIERRTSGIWSRNLDKRGRVTLV